MNPFRYLKRRKLRKVLAGLVRSGRRLLKRELAVEAKHQEDLETAVREGEEVLAQADADIESIKKAGDRIATRIYDGSYSRYVLSPGLKSFLELVLLLTAALGVRAFLYEPFKIPTGSMKPTLLHGDHVFIRKFHYGPRWPFTTRRIWQGEAPARGDIAVFNFPLDPGQDYIKRIVALPGDRVKIIGGQLFVNGEVQARRSLGVHTILRTDERQLTGSPIETQLYLEQAGEVSHYSLRGPMSSGFYNDWPSAFFRAPDSFDEFPFADPEQGLICRHDSCEVKEGYVFAMGDNRDGSADSRAWGGVPVNYLRGKATVIWFSHDWTQPVIPMGPLTIGELRWSRMFSSVDDLGTDLSAPVPRP